ncbi:cytochrome P450 [Candidatus Bathyarchaeota archaeon]|nr:cytochrome P450 [Candidatus Bathyarchaeota archaeon]
MIKKDGPSGDVFLDIVEKYPGEDVIALDSLGWHFLVASPHLLADLFVHKCYDFSKPRRAGAFIRRVVGQGLVTAEEDEHKFLRKNTMPAFHMRHIMDLYPMMWSKGSILTRTLTREVTSEDGEGQVVELGPWASKVTLDIIGIAGMGRALNTVEKASDPLQETFGNLLAPDPEKVLFGVMSLTIGYPTVRMLPWKINKWFIDLTATLNSITRERIKEKREAMRTKADDHFDILSLLIKSNNFDDEVLKDQLLTFLSAG